jgi:uncharacterized membrane protein
VVVVAAAAAAAAAVVVAVAVAHFYTSHLTQIHFPRLKFMTFILCNVLGKVTKKKKSKLSL